MPDLAKIESTLADVNKIVSQINPLIGLVGSIGVMVLKVAQRTGEDTAAFEQELERWKTAEASLVAAVDEFHQKYPQEG